jgi:NRAMP (natural resistance-associated macrophage protein)-like metal ion transporter
MVLGPGLVTGASDDDPSGIATYAIAGASLGFSTLWIALVTLPLMAATQFISATIGMVCGTGIAGTLRTHYPRWVLFPVVLCLFVANTINAGADIGAIAAAINLFFSVRIIYCIVPISFVLLALQIFGSYRLIANIFRWLTLALLSYIATAFFAHPSLPDVARGTFIPTLSLKVAFISTFVAILGTTISPYLWFWQSSQEVDEERAHGRTTLSERKGASNAELKYKAWDVNVGMFLSNLVMYFIILTTAATLNKAGQTDISSATQAAEALRPLAGDAAKYLLGLGLIGAGLLAIPVLTGSAGYAVTEAFGWRSSLDASPSRGKALYGVIVVATLVGMLMNVVGINPIKALFYTAIINAMISAPLLLMIMVMSNNKKIMGGRTNNTGVNILGWTTTALMAVAALLLIGLCVTGSA